MLQAGPYLFKIADDVADLDQVHRLNHRTFVQEIPQHADTGQGVLVDKFHDKNTYIVGLRDGRLVGMLAFHDRPPFSVASRMPNPEVLTGPGVRPLEVRLLAIEPRDRQSNVIIGLMWCLFQEARVRGHTHFVISGVLEQDAFYDHLGFEALGPAVGTGRACYTPMWATLDRVEHTLDRTMKLWARRLERQAGATEIRGLEGTTST